MNQKKFVELNRLELQDEFMYFLKKAGFSYDGYHKKDKIADDWSDCKFENDVFIVRPYRPRRANLPNFVYKPMNLEIYWFEYPLRNAKGNQEVSLDELKKILEHCLNSMDLPIPVSECNAKQALNDFGSKILDNCKGDVCKTSEQVLKPKYQKEYDLLKKIINDYFKKEKRSCSFIGCNIDKFSWISDEEISLQQEYFKRGLHDIIVKLHTENNVNTFYSKINTITDLYFAEKVLEAKEVYNKIELVLILSYEEKDPNLMTISSIKELYKTVLQKKLIYKDNCKDKNDIEKYKNRQLAYLCDVLLVISPDKTDCKKEMKEVFEIVKEKNKEKILLSVFKQNGKIRENKKAKSNTTKD